MISVTAQSLVEFWFPCRLLNGRRRQVILAGKYEVSRPT